LTSTEKPQRLIISPLKFEALPDSAVCPECGWFDVTDTEVIRILNRRVEKEPDIFYRASCKCDQNIRLANRNNAIRWKDSNIPHLDEPRTLATFRGRPGTEEAERAVNNYIQFGGAPALVLVGQTGSGKSHLLEAIGRDAMENNQTVRYDTAAAFLDRLRHTYSGADDQDLWQLTSWYQDRSLVLLDDLGAEASKDWAAQQLTDFIDNRLRNKRRLVIATNCTESELGERLGERLRSRLYQTNDELHEVKRVTMLATDYRMSR